MTPIAASARRATPTISRNILANFVGTLWTALMGPALVTVYVRLMGIEAYALVGILTTLQTAFALLDLGLSAATNRELARLSAHPERAQEARDLVRTAEFLYWALALLLGGGVSILSATLARRWVQPEQLSAATVQQAFLMMGLILAVQFPFALYSGGLNGLQRQVQLNVIMIATATLRGFGSVALLWFVSPTIQVFFGWQFLVTLIQTVATAVVLWHSLLIGQGQPRFSVPLLQRTWRFAAGMMGISFFALLLMQTDKIVLSRLLTLEKFGYYTLATVVASSVYLFISPIFAAIFPRFSQLIAAKDERGLRNLYHGSAQLLSVLLLPTALIIVFFAPELLTLWLRDSLVVQNVHLLVSLLVLGSTLNGLMSVPYALQLAAGWTKLPLYQNIVAVIILLPCLFWATMRYGAIGAAWIWIAVNAGYVLIGIQVMHLQLLPGEKLRWYVQDIGLPFVGAFSVVLAGRWLLPEYAPTGVAIVGVGCISVLTFAVACLLTPLATLRLRTRLSARRLETESNAN